MSTSKLLHAAETLELAKNRDRLGSAEPDRPLDGLWFHGTNAEFEAFKRRGLGIHFGSTSQALTRGRIRVITAKLSVKHPLRLPDLYSWYPWDVIETIEALYDVKAVASDLEELRHDLMLSHDDDQPEFYDRLIRVIKQMGYDSIIYSNTMEGDGDSIMVFDPDQILVQDSASLS